MRLEQPRIQSNGSLSERVEYLERYLFRLVAELQVVLETKEAQNTNQGG